MDSSFRRALSCIPVLLGALAFSSAAAAEDVAAAEALFNHGVADMDAGRYEKGCPAIAESQRLDPRPGTLYTQAQCEMKWGHVATAVTRLGDYLQLFEHLTPAQKIRQGDRAKVVKQQREELAPQVPELTLSLPPGAPPATVVKRDDTVVASPALGVGLPIDPGEHVVSTQVPGGPLWQQRITVGKGEKKSLVLEIKPAASVESPPVAARPAGLPPQTPPSAGSTLPIGDSPPGGRRIATYVAGGVGIAGLVVSGITGGLALGLKSTIEANCGKAIGQTNPKSCNDDGLAAGNNVQTVGLVSTIGLAAGLAGVGTAVVLLLTHHKPLKPKTGAQGRWVAADVLGIGTTGAGMAVQGSF